MAAERLLLTERGELANEEFIAAGVLILLIVLVFLAAAIKVVREYERLVVFRLGRLYPTPKGPGLTIIIPVIDRRVVVDLRTVAFDVPRQRVVSRDNVSVEVDAVVYYRVYEPNKAITDVQNYVMATNLLAQTTLRDVLGQVDLDELLSKREELSHRIQILLDTATDPWGIKVSAVTLRDVSLPDTMVRAIAKQAEAERERRSRVIMAEGEFQAAQKMKDAADLYGAAPAAMRLRELQTLTEIAREKNMVIVTTTGEQAEPIAKMAAVTSALMKKREPQG
jgi:regulator of protease activity HflC (stomatin/prohibitin superfamily)